MEEENHNIKAILNACRAGNRAGQRKLYQLYFSYGLSICLRYSGNRSEAEEILNEGFLKVFTKIDQYEETHGFKRWLRRILINASIDYYRKYKKLPVHPSAEVESEEAEYNEGWSNLVYEDILKYIQLLPPSYRLVFNLYAIDGYKHHEIAEQLNISVGASKSNYAKARKLLQSYLRKNYELTLYRHGR